MTAMSLRPLYSLLTLLTLTALVAGAVKLWYGPHHVVERTASDEESEYTFTRDLFGNRHIRAARIKREYQNDSTRLKRVEIEYYRDGKKFPWYLELGAKFHFTAKNHFSLAWLHEYGMTPAEQADCQETILRERAQLKEHGVIPWDMLWQTADTEFIR